MSQFFELHNPYLSNALFHCHFAMPTHLKQGIPWKWHVLIQSQPRHSEETKETKTPKHISKNVKSVKLF